MTIITHDFAESRMVGSSVSVSEDGHLARNASIAS